MDMRTIIDAVQSSQLSEKAGRSSAWVLIACPDTSEVLLAKRAKSTNNPGQWNLFGGGLEYGERAVETALRELGEEAGIRIDVDMLKYKGSHNGMSFFVLYAPRDQINAAIRPNRREVAKIKWFPLNALPGDLHKSTKMFIKVCTQPRIVGESLAETLETMEFEANLSESLKNTQ
jgi:8-oxo-dGTP pyrophosphatase MutT (NUDIX family)